MTLHAIRYWEMWDHLRAYLPSVRMLSILQGGKVYIEGDDYSQPEGPETAMWGRLIIVPSQRMWEDQVGTGPTRSCSFLTRAEAHPSYAPGARVDKLLDGIQDEATVLLNGHIIPKATYIMGALPLWQARPPQPLPLWDDDRGVYFTSAEWRLEVASPS